MIPAMLCWARHHRQTETILAMTVLWALVLAGTVIYSISSQMKWTREQMLRLESGYYDPQDQADAPKKPVTVWAVLGVGYAGLIGWSLSQKNPAPVPPPLAQRTES